MKPRTITLMAEKVRKTSTERTKRWRARWPEKYAESVRKFAELNPTYYRDYQRKLRALALARYHANKEKV